MYSLCTPDICDGTGDDPKCPHCSASRKREEERDALRAEGAAAENARIVAGLAELRSSCGSGGRFGEPPCCVSYDDLLALLQPPTPDTGER